MAEPWRRSRSLVSSVEPSSTATICTSPATGDCSSALSPAVSMKPPWLYVAIRTVTLCRLPVVVGLPT